MSEVKSVSRYKNLHQHTEKSLKDSPARIKELVARLLKLRINASAVTEHGNMHSAMAFYKECLATGKKLVDIIGKELNIDEEILGKIKKSLPDGKSVKTALVDAKAVVGKELNMIGVSIEEIKEAVKELQDPNKKLLEAIDLLGYTEDYAELFEAITAREVKPILGVEAYIVPTKEMAESQDKAIKSTRHHLVLLAKDMVGYKQLIKAVSKSYLTQYKSTKTVFPRMTYDLMKEIFIGGHVIALSGCIIGEVSKLLLDDQYEEAAKKALFYQSIFGKGNYYLEIQNHGLDDELKVLPQLIQMSKETGIPLVATNDGHYVNKSDARVRDMVVAMRFGTTINDPEFEKDCGELYLKGEEEMMELFKDVPEAIFNTEEIAEKCNIEFKKEKHFPKFDVPNNMTEGDYLTELTRLGVYKRFPTFDTWQDKYKKLVEDRMDRELKTIIKLHYDGYLLIVQDFIKEGKRVGLVGPGRGSAVGSLVCYLIGITDVNPLKYDLLFERFLNEERVSDPDIDTDFDNYRDLVIEYVRQKYGYNAVCSIVTFGTLAARASIRYAGRVTGKRLDLCDKIAKMVPSKPGITLKQAMEENPDLKQEYDDKRDVRELLDDAFLLEGLSVQTGVHAAGVIIADRDISDYVPLMYDADANMWITQYDKDQCESDAGLLKMDFLGLENLTIIRRTFADIKKNHGIELTFDSIDLNDKDEVREIMKEIFAKGKTKCVFQFESSGMVNLLKRFQPQSIEDIILLNAAYRPGPLQYLDEIIEVKQKRKKPEYICSAMKGILGLTYSKPIYQEQIMKIFNEIAGFSLGEADIIRRGMAKKKLKELEKYLPKFKKGLINAGSKPEDAEKFCEELMEFAKYAFNKSHSTAYAVIAYYTAWLKYKYPEEYMANVLNSASSKKLPLYIKEAKDMGISILPPSVNESGRLFTAVKKGVIRFGLAGVKNVGKSCDDILEDREKNGEFKTLKEFIERMVSVDSRAVYKQVMESLIMTGAFDDFNLNRRQMMTGCVEYVKDLKDYFKKKESPKTKAATIERALVKVEAPHFDVTMPEYDKSYILGQEKDLIGFYASGHPLQEFQKVIDEKAEIMIGDVDEDCDQNYVTIVGQISGFQPLARRSDGAAMGKFVIEDLTGEVNCICFTKAFAECGNRIKDGAVVILKGKVMVDIERDSETNEVTNSEIQISVNNVSSLNSEQKVYVKLNSVYEWEKAKVLLANYQGHDQLFVYLEDEEQIYKVKMSVKASRELEDQFNAAFGENKFAIVQGKEKVA